MPATHTAELAAELADELHAEESAAPNPAVVLGATFSATFIAAFAFAFIVGRMACRLSRWRRLTGDDAPELAAAPTTSLGAVVSQAEVGVQPPAAAVWTEEVDVL